MKVIRQYLRVSGLLLIGLGLFLFFRVGPCLADVSEPLFGKVIGVTDGDTIEVLIAGGSVKVRLHGIDCPEKTQPFGGAAKHATSDLAYMKTVKVDLPQRDKYGRIVGKITLPSGKDLGEELVRQGFAWWYEKYAPSDKVLQRLQEQAKESKVGLWVERKPIPPWQFRKTALLDEDSLRTLPPYFGNKKSRIVHAKGCAGYLKINVANRIAFDQLSDAEAVGFRRAKNCNFNIRE